MFRLFIIVTLILQVESFHPLPALRLRTFGVGLNQRTTNMVVQSLSHSVEADPKLELRGLDPSAASFSLAGPYLMAFTFQEKETTCRFYQLSNLAASSDMKDNCQHSEGALAWWCITNAQKLMDGAIMDHEIVVQADLDINHLVVHETMKSTEIDEKLTSIVSRIAAQFVMTSLKVLGKAAETNEWTVTWPENPSSPRSIPLESKTGESMAQALFYGIFDILPDQTEFSEMVNHNGLPLGHVPRSLVHRFNLLHRGIGVFVSKDRPLTLSSFADNDDGQPPPSLYVHQRTSTKRVFPSLYDMFVGGVSLANEDPRVTAEREVAEELGLMQGAQQLSECMGTCTICTAYNRCVVNVFSRTMITDVERPSWQAEEVAWGSFVPYEVVQASASLSVQRLVQRNEWPGQFPQGLSITNSNIDLDNLASRFRQDERFHDELKDWDQWDFVPDGLLVWEAWLEWLEKARESPKI